MKRDFFIRKSEISFQCLVESWISSWSWDWTHAMWRLYYRYKRG